MLTNTQHQAPDRRPSNSCDPEPHASPRYPTPYWSDAIAAFSNFLWLPNSTANHDSLINTTQSWDSKTAAHSWFSTNRIPLLIQNSPGSIRQPQFRTPPPAPPLAPPSNRHAGSKSIQTAHRRWLSTLGSPPAVGPTTSPSRSCSQAFPQFETHRQHGDAGSQNPTSRMGFRSLPGEAHGSQRRLPRHVQRQDLQHRTPRQTRHTAREPDETFAQLGYRSRKNPKQSCYIPDDAVTEHGVYHTILGPLRMAETIPAEHKECRLVQERGL